MKRHAHKWLILIGSLLPASAIAQDTRPLEIYFIDVMGGAATLVVSPDGESVLLDTGWPGLEDRDPKRIEEVIRKVAGLERLDHLVTTHWHTDHYGGVEGLSNRIQIGTFWDRGLPSDELEGVDFPDGPKPDDPLLVAYLKASEGKRRVLKAGDDFPLRGDLSAIVLTSGAKVLDVKSEAKGDENAHCEDLPGDKPEDRSDNARSLGLLFRLGKFDFLDLGDLTWNIEANLVCPVDRIRGADPMSGENERIDLYQVTHHGMDISNHPTLLRTIQPTVTVMNNGPRKGGSAAVVQLLRTIPSIEANYQLHRNLATGVDDNVAPEFIANADPAGGTFIRVTVMPDGSSYEVRIGMDGEPRTFTSR